MKNDEKGITLVEILATIVIASFTVGIIYSVALMAMEYFSVETTKTKLQQEANYIITELQRIHRHCDYYELTLLEDKVLTDGCIDNLSDPVPENNKTISSGYIYSPAGIYVNYEVNSKEHDLIFSESLEEGLGNFSIQDVENDKLEVEISTIISRYKK